MTITTISYKKVFPISSYCTEHIGLEASLSETDNPQTELEHLKIMVETLHSATIATLEEMRGSHVRDIVEPVDKIQAFKETLDMCKSLSMLEKFKPQVDRIKDEELTQFYEQKLKSLQ